MNRVENHATQSPQLVFPTVNNKNHEIEYVVFKTSLDMKMIFCCFITSILTSVFIQEYMVTRHNLHDNELYIRNERLEYNLSNNLF